MAQLSILLRLHTGRECEIDAIAQQRHPFLSKCRNEERQDADDERADAHGPDHERLEHGVLYRTHIVQYQDKPEMWFGGVVWCGIDVVLVWY
jgi:hypothetical protein